MSYLADQEEDNIEILSIWSRYEHNNVSECPNISCLTILIKYNNFNFFASNFLCTEKAYGLWNQDLRSKILIKDKVKREVG